MASRVFSVLGIAFLTIALVFLVIVSISLPSLSAMDFVRAHVDRPPITNYGISASQVRVSALEEFDVDDPPIAEYGKFVGQFRVSASEELDVAQALMIPFLVVRYMVRIMNS